MPDKMKSCIIVFLSLTCISSYSQNNKNDTISVSKSDTLVSSIKNNTRSKIYVLGKATLTGAENIHSEAEIVYLTPKNKKEDKHKVKEAERIASNKDRKKETEKEAVEREADIDIIKSSTSGETFYSVFHERKYSISTNYNYGKYLLSSKTINIPTINFSFKEKLYFKEALSLPSRFLANTIPRAPPTRQI